MPTPASSASWPALPLWILLCFAPSASALFVEVGGWYEALAKPAWTPPAWVFGPVWTALYLMMGIAAWRVWRHRSEPGADASLAIFVIHLFFNAAWMWLFFGLHLLVISAIELLVLWVMIAVLVVRFRNHDAWAGRLLMPYLAWVTYAATLNIGIAMMN